MKTAIGINKETKERFDKLRKSTDLGKVGADEYMNYLMQQEETRRKEDGEELSACCGSYINEKGFCTECKEHAK